MASKEKENTEKNAKTHIALIYDTSKPANHWIIIACKSIFLIDQFVDINNFPFFSLCFNPFVTFRFCFVIRAYIFEKRRNELKIPYVSLFVLFRYLLFSFSLSLSSFTISCIFFERKSFPPSLSAPQTHKNTHLSALSFSQNILFLKFPSHKKISYHIFCVTSNNFNLNLIVTLVFYFNYNTNFVCLVDTYK